MKVQLPHFPLICCLALMATVANHASAQGLIIIPVDPIDYVSPDPTDIEIPIADVQNPSNPSESLAPAIDPELTPDSAAETVITPFNFYIGGAVSTSLLVVVQPNQNYYLVNVGTVPNVDIITRIDPQTGPPSDYLASVPEPSTLVFGILGCGALLFRYRPSRK